MGRKSNHLMERVYAHLSKNGCRKSRLLADPDLTDTLLINFVHFWHLVCLHLIQHSTER
jgi:hypothetical protein